MIKEKEEIVSCLQAELKDVDVKINVKAGQYAGMTGKDPLEAQFFRDILGFDDYFLLQQVEKNCKAEEEEVRRNKGWRVQKAGSFDKLLEKHVQLLQGLLLRKKDLLAKLDSKIAGH